ncbi:MAG: sodium-dependent transporter [Coriobacteriales bacterium]|jgi:NSS family neurotransmitter:Na+ symporter|nr:sodium-dependent transporter [Coriobacteriales bacterium]
MKTENSSGDNQVEASSTGPGRDDGGDSGDGKRHRIQRAVFSNKLAFVLAASASAIGLGNLWRFPALAAKYGGGAFIVVYIILVATFGFTLMVAQIALGRKTGLSAIGAYRHFGKRYAFIGVLESLVPFIILPYYCVIGGWILKYCSVFMAGQQQAASDGGGFFTGFISAPHEPLVWTTAFVVLSLAIVFIGVKNGIERLNRVFMPLLLVLTLFVGLYSLTIPGALDGLAFYLIPHLEDFNIATVVAAMGQMFFSLSLAMGIMVTYGSYMRREDDLTHSVGHIEVFDTVIALLAGFMIIPAVFALSGAAGAEQAGPGLMFVTLPQVFVTTPIAQVLGIAFFVLVLFAALTSAISLSEAAVSVVIDRFGLARRKAVVVVALVVAALAVLPTLGFSTLSWLAVPVGPVNMGILDFMDFLSNSVLMPLVALFICLMVGWWVGVGFVKEEVELDGKSRFRREGLFRVMIRYVAPVFLVVILVSSILNALGLISL